MQPHKIKGDSMRPNYPDGEYLLTDKVTYRFNEPQRGDVIVFKAPTNEGEEFIKRIIGLPGESIKIVDGQVFINDQILNESYIGQSIPTRGGMFLSDGESVKVPDSEYFVLGDNRPYSSDSRTWGLVPKGKITGRAWLIYWPVSEAGAVTKPTY